ncbi:MAG: helix-turn-helix transcriptional regulator [Ilumatobacteraceae bacterium]
MEKKPLIVGSTRDWERELGLNVRSMRLHQDRTQLELAEDANISLSALKNLESGRGSALRTLILVARALGRTDWLESFAPPKSLISPMKLWIDQNEPSVGKRKRASRKPVPKASQ